MERIVQKIGRIGEHLALIRSIKDECTEKFETDPLYRGALLHYLYLLADSCIALGELVIKNRSMRPPQSYSDTFEVLAEGGVLKRAFAFEFARIAGFRNFLAHDYEHVEAALICGQILAKLGDVDTFLQQVKHALQLDVE